MRQAPESSLQILVIDGGSTDRTAEIVTKLQAEHPCISLVENPKRLQSAAINIAAEIADPRATILVRADAHSLYPPNFVRECGNALIANGATSIVVPMESVGRSRLQRAIAATQNSRLGNGGSPHRNGCTKSRFVEHGHHAAFDRQFFLSVGGYNETFSHNEDAEFDCRALDAGGRIWMCGESPITYFPRRTPYALARQYFGHGRGRARTMLMHRTKPKVRQLGPLLVLAGVLGSIGLMPLHWWFGLFPVAYALLCHIWASSYAFASRDLSLLGMGTASIVMHLSWGSGFFTGAVGHATSSVGQRRRDRVVQEARAAGTLSDLD